MSLSDKFNHLQILDSRAREIFSQLVNTFIATGEPVGARTISSIPGIDLSPASVRNVMQDLEKAGLLLSPHTSAGRIPTEPGLRLFVDTMLRVNAPSPEEQEAIRSSIKHNVSASLVRNNIDEVYSHTTQLLSGLSQCAGLVLTPAKMIPIKHIEFVRLEPTVGLVVLVTIDGMVENRLIKLPPGSPDYALQDAAGWINHNLRGLTLADATKKIRLLLDSQQKTINTLTQKFVAEGVAAWTDSINPDDRKLIVKGRGNLIAEPDALSDVELLRTLLDDMESKRELMELLALVEGADAIKIFIGSESNRDSLMGSSIVAAPFRGTDDNALGVLAVIGPKRMNYAKIVPVVEFSAQTMTNIIQQNIRENN